MKHHMRLVVLLLFRLCRKLMHSFVTLVALYYEAIFIFKQDFIAFVALHAVTFIYKHDYFKSKPKVIKNIFHLKKNKDTDTAHCSPAVIT